MCGGWRVRLIATDTLRGSQSAYDAGIGLVALMTHNDSSWGLVCDDHWNDNAARIVCTCLGYNRSVCLSTVCLCLCLCLSVCAVLQTM